MGLFRRRSRGSGPDNDLTMLTVDEAARLRAVVASWFARHGTEVGLAAGHVETDDGHRYGLWNLASRCHDDARGPRAWPELVDEHFTVLLAAEQTDIDAFTDEEFTDALRVRLVEAVHPPAADETANAPEWAPGICRVLVLDLPTTIVTPARSELERRGRQGALTDIAWQQTAPLVVTEDLHRERIEDEGRYAWCVMGDTAFTATLAMFLPDVVRRFEPDVDLSRGVIFSVPFRHQVNYRVVQTPMSVLDALLVLPPFTVTRFMDAPGPVSPSVYLWLDGQVSQVSVFEDDQIQVFPGPHLEPLLAEIDNPRDAGPSG